MGVIAAYARTGGMPPADDERLEVDADGAWRLWRTMGGERVGSFRGRLSADRRRRLARALEAAQAAPPARTSARARPDGAHEAFRAGRRVLVVPAGQPVAGGWAPLVRLVRRWSVAFARVPDAEAALGLELRASGPAIVRHGGEPLRVWPPTLHADAYARDAAGIVVGRGSVDDDGAPPGGAVATGPGWSLPVSRLPIPSTPPGGRLEVWAWLDIEGPDGAVTVRLVATAPA